MNILSLQLGSNASACLVQNNILVGAASQERFDNIKGSDAFPCDAIAWLLARAEIEEANIDLVAVSGKQDKMPLDVAADKIKYLDHHLCHAYAPLAFFGMPQDPYLIFVADGGASNIYMWDGGRLKTLAQSCGCLGQLYAAVTEKLGMKSYAHEGKVMGLAAYAKKEDFESCYNDLYHDLITSDEDNPLALTQESDLDLMAQHTRFDYQAGAAQYCLEQTVTRWVRAAIKKTGVSNIMTSGGVFTNVRLNKVIREMSEVKQTRFMPSSGNETNVFGAALLACPDLTPVRNLYWGQDYSDEEIDAFLAQHKSEYSFERHDDIEQVIADLVANKKIVARFAGRAEFGARSLGNRAILAHPADRESFYEINDQIKARDFWMPFAPTILDSDADRYLKNPYDAPYMIDSFDTTEEGRRDLCAAMHQADKTVRPQIVRKEDNPDYYRVIELFKARTGIGAVMNTSFNLHGYPLASTLGQAFFTMKNSGLRYLALGHYLVGKK